jgi:hypothetical protein
MKHLHVFYYFSNRYAGGEKDMIEDLGISMVRGRFVD